MSDDDRLMLQTLRHMRRLRPMNRYAAAAGLAVLLAACSGGTSSMRAQREAEKQRAAETQTLCGSAKPGVLVAVETNGHPLTLDPTTVSTADGHRARFGVRADFASDARDTKRYREVIRDTTATRVRNTDAAQVREAVDMLEAVRRDVCFATEGKVVAVHFVNLAVR